MPKKFQKNNNLNSTKMEKNFTRCKEALKEIWHLNRVHVSKEMSLAYRLLKKYFTNLKIFG